MLLFVNCNKLKIYKLETYTFQAYITGYKKIYLDEAEKSERQRIFKQSLENIIIHNNKNLSWKKGINSFTDRTDEEIRIMSQSRPQFDNHDHRKLLSIDHNIIGNQVGMDWRHTHYLTPVKSQGMCSSYPMAAVQVIETAYATKTGIVQELSVQQAIDCSINCTCTGGSVENIYTEIIRMKGLTSEWMYPYMSAFGKKGICDLKRLHNGFSRVVVKDFIKLKMNSYPQVLLGLLKSTLVVHVDSNNWKDYKGGIYQNYNESLDINHVVQLVGFGEDKILGKFWVIRNSWGPLWGEKGYMRLRRLDNSTTNEGDMCGIDRNTNKRVCGNSGILSESIVPWL